MLAEAIELCRAQKLQVFLALALALDALRRIVCGELEDGCAAMEESLTVFTATGAELFLPAWFGAMAQAVFACGDAPRARELLADARARSERTEERWCLAELGRIEAQFAAAAGETTRAHEALAEAARLAESQQAEAWQTRIAATQAEVSAVHGEAR